MTTISITFNPPVVTDSPELFDSKAQAFAADLNPWAQQVNAVAGEVNANTGAALAAKSAAEVARDAAQLAQSNAEQQASNAAASAQGAASTWVSGDAYTVNQVVWGGALGGELYRCITAHSGRTAAPSVDPDYWALVAPTNVVPLAVHGAGLGANQFVQRATASTVPIGASWSVQDTGGTLLFRYNGVAVFSLDSSGNIKSKANTTAYGSI